MRDSDWREHYARFTEEERAIIRELWPTKARSTEIARRLGRDATTVERHARMKMGLPGRRDARQEAGRT